MVSSLLKASTLTAILFSLIWVRPPISMALLSSTFGLFLSAGLVLMVMSFVIGIPMVLVTEKLRIGRWWSYSLLAGAVGGLFGAFWGYTEATEFSNPHGGIVFSPLTRNTPGIDEFPASRLEYVSSIAFCAILGAVLGAAFSRFYSHKKRSNNSLERSRER